MALSKRSVCLVALMAVVMATLMLSSDAVPGEWCEGIADGCSESKCRGRCGSLGFPEGYRCLKEGDTCCCWDPKRKLDVVPRD